MNLVVVLFLVAVATAAPQARYDYGNENRRSYDDVRLLRNNYDYAGYGPYYYGYEQSDGTKVEQRGEFISQGQHDEVLSVKGYYSWVAPNGELYVVSYTADDEGYHPEIQQGPGTFTPAVLKSLLNQG